MNKIITSILLMLFMGCESIPVEPTIVNECLECFRDYHFDEDGLCVCD